MFSILIKQTIKFELPSIGNSFTVSKILPYTIYVIIVINFNPEKFNR